MTKKNLWHWGLAIAVAIIVAVLLDILVLGGRSISIGSQHIDLGGAVIAVNHGIAGWLALVGLVALVHWLLLLAQRVTK